MRHVDDGIITRQTSDVRRPTSDARRQTPDVRRMHPRSIGKFINLSNHTLGQSQYSDSDSWGLLFVQIVHTVSEQHLWARTHTIYGYDFRPTPPPPPYIRLLLYENSTPYTYNCIYISPRLTFVRWIHRWRQWNRSLQFLVHGQPFHLRLRSYLTFRNNSTFQRYR